MKGTAWSNGLHMILSAVPSIVEFVDEGLGHSSYLVDLGDGTALVIDPARLPSAQLAEALRIGLSISFTADTHTHADYVSGVPTSHPEGPRSSRPPTRDCR
jgi:hydroxyacylglutathione hydrolase